MDEATRRRLEEMQQRFASQAGPQQPPGSQFGGAVKGFGKELLNPIKAIGNLAGGVVEGGKQAVEGVTDLSDRALGTNIRYNPILDPDVSASSYGNLGRGFGQVGAMIGAGLAGIGAAAVGAPAALATGIGFAGAGLAAGSAVGSGTNEAEQRALAQGRKPSARELLGGAAIGLGETLVPLGVGKVAKGALKGIKRPVLAGALAEAGQEASAEVLHSLNVGDDVSLDATATAGLYGAGPGAGAGAIAKYLRPPDQQPPVPGNTEQGPTGPQALLPPPSGPTLPGNAPWLPPQKPTYEDDPQRLLTGPPPPEGPTAPPPVDPAHRFADTNPPNLPSNAGGFAGARHLPNNGGVALPPEPNTPPLLPAPPPGPATPPPNDGSGGTPVPPVIQDPKDQPIARTGERVLDQDGTMPGYPDLPTSLVDVDPRTVEVDPRRFQTRTATKNEDGTTGRLSTSTKWHDTVSEPIVLFEQADGKRIVADGHHRMALWHRAHKAGTRPPRTIKARVLREVDGWTDKTARQTAADVNIYKGTVDSPMDIATALRGQTKEEIAAKHYDKSKNSGWDIGRDLAKLSDGAWQIMRERGEGNAVGGWAIPHNFGAAVGQYTSKPKQQAALEAMLEIQPDNLGEAIALAQMAEDGKNEQAVGPDQQDIFGGKERSDVKAMIQLISAVKTALRNHKNLGKSAYNNAGGYTKHNIGNVDTITAKGHADNSASAYQAFSSQATKTGTEMNKAVRAELNNLGPEPTKAQTKEAAKRLADGFLPDASQKKNPESVETDPEPTRAPVPPNFENAATPEPDQNTAEPTLMPVPEGTAPTPQAESDAEQRIRDEQARQAERMGGNANQKDIEGTALFGEHGQTDIVEEARKQELAENKPSKTEMDEKALAKEDKRRKDLADAQLHYRQILNDLTGTGGLHNGAVSPPFWTNVINKLDTWAKIIENLGGSVNQGHLMFTGATNKTTTAKVDDFLKRMREGNVSRQSIKYMADFLARFGNNLPYQLSVDDDGSVLGKAGGQYHPHFSALHVTSNRQPAPTDSLLAHEMGHFIWMELMSHQDRIDFLKMAKAYYRGRPDRYNAETVKGTNAGQTIQEIFAYNFQKFYMGKMNPKAGETSYWKNTVSKYIQWVHDWFTGERTTIFDPIFERMVNVAPNIRPTADLDPDRPSEYRVGLNSSLSASFINFSDREGGAFASGDFQQVLKAEAANIGAPIHIERGTKGVRVTEDDKGNAKAVAIGSKDEHGEDGVATPIPHLETHWQEVLNSIGIVAGRRLMNKAMEKALDGNNFNQWLTRYVTDETAPAMSDAVLGSMSTKAQKAIKRMRESAKGNDVRPIWARILNMPLKDKVNWAHYFRTSWQREVSMAHNTVGRLLDETNVANFKGAIGSYLRANSATLATALKGVPRRVLGDDGVWQNQTPKKDAVALADVTQNLDPTTREALGRFLGDNGKRGYGIAHAKIEALQGEYIDLMEKLREGKSTRKDQDRLAKIEVLIPKMEDNMAMHLDTMESIKEEEGVNGAELEKRALLMRKFMDQFSSYAVNAGVVPQDMMDAMRKADPFFVPQQRPDYQGRAFSDYTGAAEVATDFFDTTIAYVHFVMKQAELNTLLSQITSIDDGTVIKVSDKKVEAAVGKDNTNQAIVFLDPEKSTGKSALDGQAFIRIMNYRRNAEGQLYINKEWYSVSDPFLVDFLNYLNMGSGANPSMIRALSIPSQIFRTMISVMPNFIANQFLKDPVEAQFLADTQKGGVLVPKPIDAFKRVWKINVSKNLDDNAYIAMVNGGVNTARDLQALMSEDSVAHRSLVGQLSEHMPNDVLQKFLSSSGGQLEQWLNVIHFTDQQSRLAAFAKDKAAGKSNRAAMVTATEIHDFAMHGTGTRAAYLRTAIPYLQSFVTGIDRTRGVTFDASIRRDIPLSRKGDENAKRRLATRAGAVVLMSALFFGWDELMEEIYPQHKTMSLDDRARPGLSFYYPTAEGRAYLEKHNLSHFPKSMPLAQRNRMEQRYYVPMGHNTGRIAKFISHTVRGLTGRGGDNFKLAFRSLGGMLVPPHSTPIAGAWSGITGGAVQYKNRGLPADQQVGKSKTGTAIGHGLNVSPDKVEKIIEDLMPGLGPAVLHMFDTFYGEASKAPVPSLLPTFIRSDRMHTRLTEDFWKDGNQIQADDNAYKAYETRLIQGETKEAIKADIGPKGWINVLIGEGNREVSGLIRRRQTASNDFNKRVSASNANASEIATSVQSLGKIAFTGIDTLEGMIGNQKATSSGWDDSGMARHLKSIMASNMSERQKKNALRAAAAEFSTLIRRGNYGLYMTWRAKTVKKFEAKGE